MTDPRIGTTDGNSQARKYATWYQANFNMIDTICVIDFIDSLDVNRPNEIHHEILDTGRWESHEFTVFEFSDGSLLGVEHSEGLTEYQESTGVTDVYEVAAQRVVTTQYVKVPE